MKRIVTCVSGMLLAFGLAACGGGGGDTPSTVTYTGLETQAEITETNSEPLATGAAGSKSKQEAAAIFYGASAGLEQGGEGGSVPNRLDDLLKGVVAKIDFQQAGSLQFVAVTQGGRLTDDGCGGYADYSGSDNGSRVDVSLSLHNFCVYDLVTSGYVFLNGRMRSVVTYANDPSDPYNWSSLLIDIGYLEVRYSGQTYKFSGNILMDFAAGTVTFTHSYFDGGKVYRIQNFSYDEATEALSGRFYHPDYGYVDFDGIVRYDADGLPTMGSTVTITGQTGTATFTMTGSSLYEVCWDDGTANNCFTGSW